MAKNAMKEEVTVFHCPKCGKECRQSGVVAPAAAGPAGEMPVFQCETCEMPVEFGGVTFPAAYTFCVGPDGKPFDASELS
jgi:hypothetical protein